MLDGRRMSDKEEVERSNMFRWGTRLRIEARGTYELTVNIPADGHRTSNRLHIGLLHQDLPRLNSARRKVW